MNLGDHLNGPEHLCIFVSLLLCLSQSVFGTIQRRLACPCAALTPINSQVFCVAQLLRILCVFSVSPLKGGISFCVVVSYGHVSVIGKISSIGRVVNLLGAHLWSGRGITGASLRNLKIVIEHVVI